MKQRVLATTAERRCMYVLVGSIAAACYLNGLGGEFVHDDVPAVVQNKDVVVAARPLFAAFADDFWGTPMTDSRSHKSYRPLTTLSFRANYLLVGLRPCWFHTTNVLLHVIATIMFTKVCVKVVDMSGPFATLAGLMFAVHPIHTEAVTGIVGRADVLACIFFLASLLTYHDSRKQCRVFLSILFGGISILAKETGITIFLVNLIFDIYKGWHLKKTSDVRWAKEKTFFIKRIIVCFITFTTLIILRLILLNGLLPTFSRGDNPAAFHPSFQVRFLTFAYIASFNFWLLLCPSHLSHDWQMGSIPLITSILDYRNLLTILIFTLISIIFIFSLPYTWTCQTSTVGAGSNCKHSAYSLSLGLIILLIPFLPGSNLITTAGFVLAERVLYIPSMGFILLVVQGVQTIWQTYERHRQTLLSCVFGLLIVHGLQCVTRNKDWLSRESLLRAGVQTLPHNAKMHYNFANFLRDSGRIDLAKTHYHTAIKLWPTYASAHNNVGTLIKNGEDAEKHFLLAIRFNQGHLNAHYNLGQLYRKQNRTEEAKLMLQKCILISPNFTLGYVELLRLIESQSSHKIGALLRTIVRQSAEAEYAILYADYLKKQGNNILALKYYNNALFESHHKLNAFIGSATILRLLGFQSRLFQLITRYHVMQRTQGHSAVLQSNIYLQRWYLSYELEKHAIDYGLKQWAKHSVGDINLVNSNIDERVTGSTNIIMFHKQRCSTTQQQNVTIVTKNCLESL